MIKIITIISNFIVAAVVALTFTACKSNDNWGMGIKGNGSTTTETRTITENFTGIKVSASIDVVLEQADIVEVTVTADSNLLPVIDTKVENGVLVIKPNTGYSSSKGVKVTVKMPKIDSLKASSSSSISASKTIIGQNINIESSSSSNINLALEFDNIKADSSSSSDIKLTGKALKMNCKASSSSDIIADKLLVNDIVADASSSATIKVQPIVSLKANASSSADVIYLGTPKNVEKEESSGGSVSGK